MTEVMRLKSRDNACGLGPLLDEKAAWQCSEGKGRTGEWVGLSRQHASSALINQPAAAAAMPNFKQLGQMKPGPDRRGVDKSPQRMGHEGLTQYGTRSKQVGHQRQLGPSVQHPQMSQLLSPMLWDQISWPDHALTSCRRLNMLQQASLLPSSSLLRWTGKGGKQCLQSNKSYQLEMA